MLSSRPWTYGMTMFPTLGLPLGVVVVWLLLLEVLVPCVVLPTWVLFYHFSLSCHLRESIKHIGTKYGIQTYFKGNRTIKQLLVRPKDQDPKEKKNEVIYSYQCGAINCGEEYIRDTSRTLREWYKEHLREPIPNPGAQSTYWTSTKPWQFQHPRQGGPGHDKVN